MKTKRRLQLVDAGHDVTIQSGAGVGSAITDEAFESQGARIVKTAEEVWQQEMIVKVKEPLPEEYPRIDSQVDTRAFRTILY